MDLGVNTVEELAEIMFIQGKIKNWEDTPETEEDPDE